MDFDLANEYAEQIRQGQDEHYKCLVKMCIPYLLGLRKRLGFYCISLRDVTEELAADAVSDAIMEVQRRQLPFTICLHNAFRDLCRKRLRTTREHDTDEIMDKCDIPQESRAYRINSRYPSPPVWSQDQELTEMVHNILTTDHEPFSTQVIYEKTRGSTYPEMAELFKTTLNECKRVYWHDVTELRNKLNPNPDEE